VIYFVCSQNEKYINVLSSLMCFFTLRFLHKAWCDDYVNKHLECALYPQIDQYLCKCSGKATNCPTDCLDGSDPLVSTHEKMGPGSVLCSGIPQDSPNYILKETK
jgi:hypothetical protein